MGVKSVRSLFMGVYLQFACSKRALCFDKKQSSRNTPNVISMNE